MCGCGKNATMTRTVWRVVYPDGSRSVDYPREGDARRENNTRGGVGTVESAQQPV